VDGWLVFDRAGEFTGSAAYTVLDVHIRLSHLLGIPAGVENFRRAQVNGLGRSGAPLLADDTLRSGCPGQATAAIIEGGSDSDRLCLSVGACGEPTLFLWPDFPDCTGRAHLAAKHTAWFAIADAGHEHRRPQAFKPCFRKRGLQGVVGADLHAFAATDAAREKILLVQGAGRPN